MTTTERSSTKLRLFLDANILFTAAHNPKGKAALVIYLGSLGQWRLYSSAYALAEARRNIERKFPPALDDLIRLEQHIQFVEHQPGLAFPPGLVKKDRPIFQAALACQATHLLTGDLKDFGRLMNQSERTLGICIQTVAEFLEALLT